MVSDKKRNMAKIFVKIKRIPAPFGAGILKHVFTITLATQVQAAFAV